MLSPCGRPGTTLWASCLENVDIISRCGSRHFSCLSSEHKQAILLHESFQSVFHGSVPRICGLFQKQNLGYGNFCKGPPPHTTFAESKDSLSIFSPDLHFPTSWMPSSEHSGSTLHVVKSMERSCVVLYLIYLGVTCTAGPLLSVHL